MSDYVIHTVNLSVLQSSHEVKFVEAQWWDDRSPLVVVTVAYHGHLTKLRMDLDKMNFIDHLDDPRADKTVQNLAKSVWKIVVSERFGALSAAEERALGV